MNMLAEDNLNTVAGECLEEEQGAIDIIKAKVHDSNINNNEFYQYFRANTLPPDVLKTVFQQYFYYIRTFPKILAGCSARLDDEFTRMKLSRTVVSELGDNGSGKPHFEMFLDSINSIGVFLDDWQQAEYVPETKALVEGLERIFLQEHTDHAIGAHYVIEEFGFPMIVNLYEGFRKYEGWTHESYCYFFLHILIESNHVDWIADAVEATAKSPEAKARILAGADDVLDLLSKFWSALYREASA